MKTLVLLASASKKKNPEGEEESMEADADGQREWDTVGVYVLPLDINAGELVGFVRPDENLNTHFWPVPPVADSVMRAQVEVMQEDMENNPSGDQMDTGTVVRAAWVEAIQNTELLRIEE